MLPKHAAQTNGNAIMGIASDAASGATVESIVPQIGLTNGTVSVRILGIYIPLRIFETLSFTTTDLGTFLVY